MHAIALFYLVAACGPFCDAHEIPAWVPRPYEALRIAGHPDCVEDPKIDPKKIPQLCGCQDVADEMNAPRRPFYALAPRQGVTWTCFDSQNRVGPRGGGFDD